MVGVDRQSTPSFICLADWRFTGLSLKEKAPRLEKFENPFTGQVSRMRPNAVHSHTATQTTPKLRSLDHSLVPFLTLIQGPQLSQAPLDT